MLSDRERRLAAERQKRFRDAHRGEQPKPPSVEQRARRREAGRRWRRASRLTVIGRAADLFVAARGRALKAELEFEIDRAWVIERLSTGRCEVTGLCFVLEAAEASYLHPFAPAIDRRDPTAGYTRANCQLVVNIHNIAKNQFAAAAWETYVEAAAEAIAADRRRRFPPPKLVAG